MTNRLDDTREFTPNGRNLVVAARRLRDAKDEELKLIARRDPGMIREVSMELLLEIEREYRLIERCNLLSAALQNLIIALADEDQDGLTEFAEPMIAARRALKVE